MQEGGLSAKIYPICELLLGVGGAGNICDFWHTCVIVQHLSLNSSTIVPNICETVTR